MLTKKNEQLMERDKKMTGIQSQHISFGNYYTHGEFEFLKQFSLDLYYFKSIYLLLFKVSCCYADVYIYIT